MNLRSTYKAKHFNSLALYEFRKLLIFIRYKPCATRGLFLVAGLIRDPPSPYACKKYYDCSDGAQPSMIRACGCKTRKATGKHFLRWRTPRTDTQSRSCSTLPGTTAASRPMTSLRTTTEICWARSAAQSSTSTVISRARASIPSHCAMIVRRVPAMVSW